MPAAAFVLGTAGGIAGAELLVLAPVLLVAGWIAWWRRCPHAVTGVLLAAGFLVVGATLAAEARDRAMSTPLRAELDRTFGGFAVGAPGAGGRHDPIAIRAVILEDAARLSAFTVLRARIQAIRPGQIWVPSGGVVTLTVGGRPPQAAIDAWQAGRAIETFATFRRPATFRNEGLPDLERQLALDGTTLFAGVKTGLLVTVQAPGTVVTESAAAVRRHVRRSLDRWVAPHASLSAAVIAAVLIGDRSGLPDETRLRLQEAGTYHVIAISGGNIAILAGLTLLILLACGVTGRGASIATIGVLLAYAQVVTSGPSVWRATIMAVAYLSARLLDHRSPPWQALALAAVVILAVQPLDVRDAGFLLTFGATAALIESARLSGVSLPHPRPRRWLVASLAASAAAELALLPVGATTFSRVTGAGLILNLTAVPLMALAQIAGLVVCAFSAVESLAAPAGWVAHLATMGLVDGARLVDLAPWLVVRVPPPPTVLVAAYYASLTVAMLGRGRTRRAAVAGLVLCGLAMVSGQPAGWLAAWRQPVGLRVTALDVGQGDATLLEVPGGPALLVDAAGSPFGGTFDIGARVVTPALWARGLRRLDTLLLTHGDPDHIGGAPSVVADLGPRNVWQGIPVGGHAGLEAVLARARQAGARVEDKQAGDEVWLGAARIRVLHPPPADWERSRVRNDDSVAIEVRYGDVAVLLMGDVSAEVERAILPRLARSPVRILKVGHHGSRTSTSRELLEHWRPQMALISCGRGNAFGHPAPEVLQRLAAIGAVVYRTDLDGQITIESDGSAVAVRTYVSRDP